MGFSVIHVVVATCMIIVARSQQWEHTIHVSAGQGRDNGSCLASNSAIPCKTLDFVLKYLQTTANSTKIAISNGIYVLNNTYNLTNGADIAFIGGGDEVKIQCDVTKEAGLSIEFWRGVWFEKLLFQGCGRLRYVAPFGLNDSLHQIYSGISLTYCKDLYVKNCTFRDSPGFSLVLYDVGGDVNIIDSHFLHNTPGNQSTAVDVISTGGGVFLHLTKFGSVFPFNDTDHRLYSNNNNYSFLGSVFMGNHYKNPDEVVPPPFGRGAGLTVFVCGSALNNTIMIDACNFIANQAIWGGAIFAEFHEKAQGNNLHIRNCIFLENIALYAGGAVRTGTDVEDNAEFPLKGNMINYSGNRFSNNRATVGGAVSHYGSTYLGGYQKIHITQCKFHNNFGTMGSAIGVTLNNKNSWIDIGPENPYFVEITDCEVVDNTMWKRNGHIVGMGAVYSSQVPMILRGNNTFRGNKNTALLLDNAPLKVCNTTLFIGNIGIKGGALAMYGQTRLIMTKNSHLYFKENKATRKGGAIYIRTPGPEAAPFRTRGLRRHDCIIGYEDEKGTILNVEDIPLGRWKTKLDFISNSAPVGCGDSIYATTLQSCYLHNEESRHNTAFEWNNIVDYHHGKVANEISTDPVAIEFEENDWIVAPDELFNAGITLIDEKNSPVYGIVKITVKSESESDPAPKLFPESSLFLVQYNATRNKNNYSYIIQDLKLLGTVGDTFSIEINTVDGEILSVSSRNLTLQNCLDGFEQLHSDKKRGTCSCMSAKEDLHEGINRCSTDGKQVFLKTGYWGGIINKQFITYPCPPNYCKFDESKFEFPYKKSDMCAGNRDSSTILCGKCKTNYTVSLGGENCRANSSCKKSAVSWGIPLFLILTIPGVLLLLRLNVDIFTSYLNSWLYFYQVLPFVMNNIEYLDEVMQGIINLASFKLPGVQLSCFVKNLDNLKKLGFNYLPPLYVLFLLLVISQTARCRNCSWIGRTNVYRAISTMLVICYTNLTLISFNVIHWVKMSKLDMSILYIQGSITDKHVPPLYYVLLIIAIIVILCFVVVLPLLLLCRPFFVRKFQFMGNFAYLYDIFQQCFRDGVGWFSAYYFLCRIALLILTASPSTPGPYKRFLTESLVVLSLVIFVFVKPYRTDGDNPLRWLNVVDTVILTDLCLIAIMSSSQNSEASTKTINFLKAGVNVLSWLPMVYLIVLIVLTIKHYCKRYVPSRKGYQSLDEPSSAGSTDGP